MTNLTLSISAEGAVRAPSFGYLDEADGPYEGAGWDESHLCRILLCSSADALASALAGETPYATVEAEYGDRLVPGSSARLTLAHHGARAGFPCPCIDRKVEGGLWPSAIGISHLDLDALGGIIGLLGVSRGGYVRDSQWEWYGFWRLAAYVDVHGAHRLPDAGADVARIHAWWAWSADHRVCAPRDGSVADVSAEIVEAATAVAAILADDPALIAAGEKFRLEGAALEAESFCFGALDGSALLRRSDRFVNHLYVHDGVTAGTVTALNTRTGAITLSFEAGERGSKDAAAIMRQLFGPQAGGRRGIAGTPRGRTFFLADALMVYRAARREQPRDAEANDANDASAHADAEALRGEGPRLEL